MQLRRKARFRQLAGAASRALARRRQMPVRCKAGSRCGPLSPPAACSSSTWLRGGGGRAAAATAAPAAAMRSRASCGGKGRRATPATCEQGREAWSTQQCAHIQFARWVRCGRRPCTGGPPREARGGPLRTLRRARGCHTPRWSGAGPPPAGEWMPHRCGWQGERDTAVEDRPRDGGWKGGWREDGEVISLRGREGCEGASGESWCVRLGKTRVLTSERGLGRLRARRGERETRVRSGPRQGQS
jgi:hypothetical protein